jgi:uncharacterized membrane protein
MIRPTPAVPMVLALILTACGSHKSASNPDPASSAFREPRPTTSIATAADTQPYSGIRPRETVHFTGTEPFWGGQVSDAALTYTTPENQAGEMVAVDRFAGRNGISFSGELGGMPFVLAVTPGTCSDGMSDRSYPFTVTLQVRGEQRKGCAWTDRHPYSGPRQP